MSRMRRLGMDILLSTALLTDKGRENLVAAIGDNAPKSDLYKAFTTIQVSVADLIKDGGDFTKMLATVAITEALLASQRQSLSALRAKVDGDLISLRGLTETKGTSPADAKAIGFRTWDRAVHAHPMDAPDGAAMKVGKRKGQYRLVVLDSLGRVHFTAQLSTNGGQSWTDMPGKGKQRKPTGYASGTALQIRFAALYGQESSSWSTPFSFTVP